MSGPPDSGYRYEGPASLQLHIDQALRRVVDPEVALNIVDVGLVYDVAVNGGVVHVTMTMTSAACPVTEVILDDVVEQLLRVLPDDMDVEVQLTWQPAWSPERLTPSARAFMQW